jgi:hypothetical protein
VPKPAKITKFTFSFILGAPKKVRVYGKDLRGLSHPSVFPSKTPKNKRMQLNTRLELLSNSI